MDRRTPAKELAALGEAKCDGKDRDCQNEYIAELESRQIDQRRRSRLNS